MVNGKMNALIYLFFGDYLGENSTERNEFFPFGVKVRRILENLRHFFKNPCKLAFRTIWFSSPIRKNPTPLKRQIAISDIHGCRKTFQALLEKIAFSLTDELFLLGDYIDRGPDSKGVMDDIMQMQEDGYSVICLRGNHEESMMRSRSDITYRAAWMGWGGKQTLESFGIKEASSILDVESKYWKFMKGLKYFHETEQFILVHAGLNFDASPPFENHYSMMWIRDWYEDIDREWLNGRIIIHGHTPAKHFDIRASLFKTDELPAIDIDNGCVYGHIEGMGRLCAFDLTNQKLYFQPHVDPLSSYFLR
jgi:serine/threonine protein phosphatase 1